MKQKKFYFERSQEFDENLFYRPLDLERAQVDEGERSVQLSFSSETPVRRWYGDEILLHGEKNVDLSRLRKVGSLIYGHAPGDMKNIIGPVRKVWLEGRRGEALVGFDEDETGDLAMKKVKSKSLRGVSFGYMIQKGRQLRDDEEWEDPETKVNYKGPALIATRWTPYEISLTPIPADPNVGVGREAARSLDGIEIENKKREDIEMKPEEIQAMIDASIQKLRETIEGLEIPKMPSIEDIVKQVRELLPAEQTQRKFAVSFDEFDEIAARAAAISPEAEKRAYDMLREGKDMAAMKDELLQMAGGDADAANMRKAGAGKDGTGTDENDRGEQAVVYDKAEEMPDEDFSRMLAQ
jgi:hypothetical protein